MLYRRRSDSRASSRAFAVTALMLAACGPMAAPRAAPRTLHYVELANGHVKGFRDISYTAGGTRIERSVINDRGRGPDLRMVTAYDERGAPRWMRMTGLDYWHAPVDERLDTVDGQVLVDGDPLANMGAVRNAPMVVCRGRIYDPAAIFEALGGPHRR